MLTEQRKSVFFKEKGCQNDKMTIIVEAWQRRSNSITQQSYWMDSGTSSSFFLKRAMLPQGLTSGRAIHYRDEFRIILRTRDMGAQLLLMGSKDDARHRLRMDNWPSDNAKHYQRGWQKK